jgi:hypothetical protein
MIHHAALSKYEFEQFISNKAIDLQFQKTLNITTEVSSQENSLNRLLLKATRSNNEEKFLALYDAAMRNLEIILLYNSLLITKTPHLVLKKVVQKLDPTFEIIQLVEKRHQIKKLGAYAELNDLELVGRLLNLLSEKISMWYK